MTMTVTKPISDKQATFLQQLLDERDLGDIEVPAMQTLTGGRDGTASALIDTLLKRPYRPKPVDPATPPTGLDIAPIPTGRYAIEDDDGKLRFFKVDVIEKEGRWQGWRFVREQKSDFFPARDRLGRQAPGGFYEGAEVEMLARVCADPEAATKRYGIELGVCGCCGRELTDETSRRLGIGPECRKKRNW